MLNVFNQIFVAIVLMMLTGVFSNIFWWFLFRKRKKRLSELACITLRAVCLFYVVPIGIILINVFRRDGYLQGNHIWQLNFRVTKVMGAVGTLFLILWIGIAVFKLCKMHFSKKQYIIGDYPEDDKMAI